MDFIWGKLKKITNTNDICIINDDQYDETFSSGQLLWFQTCEILLSLVGQ